MGPFLKAESRLKCGIILSRAASIIVAGVFIPLCAVPLGTSSLTFAIIGALACSALWNMASIVHYIARKKQPTWQLVLLMDVIISPVVLIIFALVARADGLSMKSSSDSPNQRDTVAFALLLSVGGLHLLTFAFSLTLMLISGSFNFGRENPPTSLTKTPRASFVNSLAGRNGDVESVQMGSLRRPREAVIKPPANGPQRTTSSASRTELLPQYTAQDTTMPPPYEPKTTLEW